MKPKSFIDELKKQGVVVKNATRHYKLYYEDKISICIRHPTKELTNEYMKSVRKQLGLK